MEAELRVALFDRQTKPLRLSRDGQTALELGQRVLAAARTLTESLGPGGEPSGVLRLGVAHALAPLVTAGPLDLLRARYPGLAPQISSDWTGALLERVASGSLDAAVIMLAAGAEPRGELHATKLRDETIEVVGAADLAARRWSSLAELNAVGWVVQPEGCGYRAALIQRLDRLGAGSLNVAVEAFGQDLQLSVIARGAGFGLMPASQVTALAARYQVRPVRVADFQLATSLWFVRPRHVGRLAEALDAIEQSLDVME
jgi:DNA-binding transcriptional LysR family regulator